MDETTAGPPPARFIAGAGGARIAYRRQPARGDGAALPGVVFLSGFRSNMLGQKASHLAQWCAKRGQAFMRFDYRGHGESDGEFEDGCIGDWADDAVRALDAATRGRQVLVGSSMGGWLMILVALARPRRVAALVGLAAAPDFTEDLIWDPMSAEDRASLMAQGRIEQVSEYCGDPYVITRRLIEDGRRHLALRGPIAINRPVRLIHGVRDPDAPWRTSLRLAEALSGDDVAVTLVKDGDHRLSRPNDLARMTMAVAEASK